MSKPVVAVFFGGVSPEHDVSIVTGLQVLAAIDRERYDTLPVYIDPHGVWYIGDELASRDFYWITPEKKKKLTAVELITNQRDGIGRLQAVKPGWFGAKITEFDVAIPAFHGLIGEDGGIQGLFEVANVAYTGMRLSASAICMSKHLTKKIARSVDIPVLEWVSIERPTDGRLVFSEDELKEQYPDITFPAIAKPAHLGSSIGVAKVKNYKELATVLPNVFKYDWQVVLEPTVSNLIEYNVAVRRYNDRTVTSSIESPKSSEELLDFKQKYLAGNKSKITGISPAHAQEVAVSEGMASLTREIDPKMDKKIQENIRDWSGRIYDALNGTGCPRIDYLCDQKSGKVWLNEINPCPGSFGYFLWEQSDQGTALFTDLLNQLIHEAYSSHQRLQLPLDPTPEEARLFKR